MSYRLPETWTQDEEDELIYLYENHTHGFIISSFEGRKSKTQITSAIKTLKESNVVDSNNRLDLYDRTYNDEVAEMSTEKKKIRSAERKYYLERAQKLFGI